MWWNGDIYDWPNDERTADVHWMHITDYSIVDEEENHISPLDLNEATKDKKFLLRGKLLPRPSYLTYECFLLYNFPVSTYSMDVGSGANGNRGLWVKREDKKKGGKKQIFWFKLEFPRPDFQKGLDAEDIVNDYLDLRDGILSFSSKDDQDDAKSSCLFNIHQLKDLDSTIDLNFVSDHKYFILNELRSDLDMVKSKVFKASIEMLGVEEEEADQDEVFASGEAMSPSSEELAAAAAVAALKKAEAEKKVAVERARLEQRAAQERARKEEERRQHEKNVAEAEAAEKQRREREAEIMRRAKERAEAQHRVASTWVPGSGPKPSELWQQEAKAIAEKKRIEQLKQQQREQQQQQQQQQGELRSEGGPHPKRLRTIAGPSPNEQLKQNSFVELGFSAISSSSSSWSQHASGGMAMDIASGGQGQGRDGDEDGDGDDESERRGMGAGMGVGGMERVRVKVQHDLAKVNAGWVRMYEGTPTTGATGSKTKTLQWGDMIKGADWSLFRHTRSFDFLDTCEEMVGKWAAGAGAGGGGKR